MSTLDQFYEAIVLGSKRHPKSPEINYSYGTAGFRTKLVFTILFTHVLGRILLTLCCIALDYLPH
jgi:hypothetical protein